MNIIDKKTALESLAQKNRILNPQTPKPRIDAIIVRNSGRMLAGKPRNVGDMLLVFDPQSIPDGFVEKSAAEELVSAGYCDRATPEQIEQFLEAQNSNTFGQ